MEKGDNLFVTREGETTTIEVTALRLGISNAYVFAGAGSPDTNGDGVFDGADDLSQSSAVGVASPASASAWC